MLRKEDPHRGWKEYICCNFVCGIFFVHLFIMISDQQIQALQNNQNPTLSDIMNLLLNIHQTTKTNSMVLESVQQQLGSMQVQINQNSQSIAKLESANVQQNLKISELYRKICDNNSGINQLAQQDVEKQIVVTGFKIEPDIDIVTSKLFTLLNCSIDTVEFKYSLKQKDGSYSVVIGFNLKSDKINFMQKAFKNGPIFLKQVCTGAEETSTDKIKLFNKLSNFNHQIRIKLSALKQLGFVGSMKFRSCFYEYSAMENNVEKWFRAQDMECLHKLTAIYDSIKPKKADHHSENMS